MMKNALTIDVEDWYMTHDFNFARETWDGFEDRVEGSTRVLLEMLERHQLKATFFILGCVAQRHPELVRDIAAAGHEVASHGGWHTMVCKQDRQEFAADVLETKVILENLSGQAVNMYRAPSWSISPESLWALEVLEEEGFICDSSIQPFKTPLSGIGNAPVFPYHPVVNGQTLKLIEFPPTVLELGRVRLPFAGGFYFRMLPQGVFSRALQKVNVQGPGMLYIHPWELDGKQPRLPVSSLTKLTHYGNLGKTYRKLDHVLSTFDFVPLGELLKEGEFPDRTVI